MPSITGSNFEDEFKLKQLHFHWGYNDYQGSEHLIDNEKFPLEVRFFLYYLD
jgi:carbonic anhydrase